MQTRGRNKEPNFLRLDLQNKNSDGLNYEGGEAEDRDSPPSGSNINENASQIDDESQTRSNNRRHEEEAADASDDSEEYIRKRDEEHLKFLKLQGISEYDIESVDINSLEQIIKLKNSFRVRFPLLITNILKIVLHKSEEKLAC